MNPIASPFPEPDPRGGPPRAALLAAALVLLTLIAYAPAFRADFIWDDDQYVTANPHLRSVEGLGRIWIPRETPQYYPLVFTTFWLEYQLWEDDPRGYHAVNVLLHALTVVLVWRLATSLRLPGAWVIAAVFAVHPVHAESVVWVTERKNVLSGCFYMAAALAYRRFDRRPGTDARPARSRLWYAVAFGLFTCALLSKSVTSSLPVALVLFALWEGRRLSYRLLAPLVPFLLLGMVLGLHTAHLERTHVGAAGPAFDLAPAERLIIASRAFLFYPWKLLVPRELTFIYPRWTIDATSIVAYWAVPVGLVVAGGALLAWRRGHRGPALAVAFYAVSIFPALGFVNVYPMLYSFVADHFQYLASLGIIALVVGTLARTLPNARLATALAAAVITALAALTAYQCTMYHDYAGGGLWRWTLRNNPRAWLAHVHLGIDAARQGDFETAEVHLSAAEAIEPDATWVQLNVGGLHLARGRPREAVASYRRAMETAELDRGRAGIHPRLTMALLRIPDPTMVERADAVDAAEAWVAATERGDLAALDGLARALERAGHPAEARVVLAEALVLARKLGRTEAIGPIEQRLDALGR